MADDYYDDSGKIFGNHPAAQPQHENVSSLGNSSNVNSQPRRGGRVRIQQNQNKSSMQHHIANGKWNRGRSSNQRLYNQNSIEVNPGPSIRNQNYSHRNTEHLFSNDVNHERISVFDESHSQSASAHLNSHTLSNRNYSRHNRTDVPARGWKSGYGITKLLEVSAMDATDILLEFNNNSQNFTALLNDDTNLDIIVLTLKCLSTVCSTTFDDCKLYIMMEVCNSNFIRILEKYITDLAYETHLSRERNKLLWENMSEFWTNVFQLFNTIIDLLPSKAVDCFATLVDMAEFCLHKLRDRIIISDNIYELLSKIQNKFTKCEEKANLKLKEVKQGSNLSSKGNALPSEDFRHIEIMPTVKELTAKQRPHIRANIINGAYENVDHYLDVQFRLMREDFICPLREGIVKYLENPNARKFDNVRLYKKVRLSGLTILRDGGMGTVVTFDESLVKDKSCKEKSEMKQTFANTKRFMFGSLLCFTKDNFQTMFHATVHDGSDIAEGQVTVALDGYIGIEDLTSDFYLMLESEVYFLPYYYVLKALQNPNLADVFPMERYIVDVQTKANPPAYLNKLSRYRICNGSTVSMLNNLSWPSADEVGLDVTQYKAFKMALTKEFVTIQGPPGTGKTFVGLKVAKTLIENNVSDGTPILVVSYTNHALDQFLEGLLDVTQKIVRIGGQSKNETLKEYNLQVLRKQQKKHMFKYKFFQLTDKISKTRQMINFIESRSGIFNLLKFTDHIGINVVKFLEPFKLNNRRSALVNWLMMSDKVVNNSIHKTNLKGYQFHNNESDVDDIYYSDGEDERQKWLDIDDDVFQVSDVSAVNFFSVKTLSDEITQMEESMTTLTDEGRDDMLTKISILYYERDFLKTQLNHSMKHEHVLCNPDVDDPASFNVNERWALYWQWIKPVLNSLNIDFTSKMIHYKQAKNNYDELVLITDKEIIANADVIGVTTTGAARMQSLLRSLKSRIVIVEEAAEVMESHIIVSLSSFCEHVIMIGDHQQLRPTAATYYLTRRFNLDISLFERMVKNGNHCYQLEVQHRMRPEIAALISPTIYPNLQNHPVVNDYPSIKGVTKSLAFISHQVPEKNEESLSSHLNPHEAKFLLRLAKYLIQQGYEPNDITILAAYSGQMFYLKEERRRYDILTHVRITVLDSYQGKESKIILLSLVRSNPNKEIGFLSIENRVCVALSRAKEGLYIIGNMDNMKHKSDLWKEVDKSLVKQNAVGDSLTLQCGIHQDTFTLVRNEKDFERVPEGGCSRICNALLKCGHNCRSACHPQDRGHENYLCTAPCVRKICIYGHQCPDPCYKECSPCNVLVTCDLPCSHQAVLKCHIDPNEYNCVEIVKMVSEVCNHEIEKPCHVMDDNVDSTVQCMEQLSCSQECTQLCHKKRDLDHLYYELNWLSEQNQ